MTHYLPGSAKMITWGGNRVYSIPESTGKFDCAQPHAIAVNGNFISVKVMRKRKAEKKMRLFHLEAIAIAFMSGGSDSLI